jgi:hypothetical protein
MPTATDPEEIPQLYGALKERILAEDGEGTIQIYYELLSSGRPLSEIMARAGRALDGPQTGAPDLAGEASAGGADAKILDEPPAPERLPEPAPGSIAGRVGEPPAWAIASDAPGEASSISGDTGNRRPSPGPAYAAPAARLELRRVAAARLSPITRLGLAAGAIVAAASIGVLVMHPAAQQVAPGGPPASAAAVSARAETSSTAKAAATPPATVEAVSATATAGGSTTEPEPAPAASTVAMLPPAEPAPSAQPVPKAPERETAAAVAAPAPAAAPAEPVPAALPAPSSPTPEAPPAVAAPAPKIPPDQPRLAAAEIAALLARGNSLLGVGDIASARLFYERATDAGDEHAALRMGATYDPGFLDRVRLPHMHGDAAQALSWYRRARDLGEGEAELWIQGLETKSGR